MFLLHFLNWNISDLFPARSVSNTCNDLKGRREEIPYQNAKNNLNAVSWRIKGQPASSDSDLNKSVTICFAITCQPLTNITHNCHAVNWRRCSEDCSPVLCMEIRDVDTSIALPCGYNPPTYTLDPRFSINFNSRNAKLWAPHCNWQRSQFLSKLSEWQF